MACVHQLIGKHARQADAASSIDCFFFSKSDKPLHRIVDELTQTRQVSAQSQVTPTLLGTGPGDKAGELRVA